MREWNATAFVVRVGGFREIDIWLKLLVPEKGMLTAFAFGGAKSKRRFCGCLDVLNTVSCHVKRSKRGDFYTLEEASLLSGPTTLRSNWSRMGLAQNCLRFLERIAVPEENAAELFLLMEDLRQTLESGNRIASLFSLFFRLAIACRLGYAPDFMHCGICRRPLCADTALFVQDEGMMLCARCRKKSEIPATYQVELPQSVRTLLQSVRNAMPSAWSDASLFSREKRLCAYAIDGFIAYHLGIVWDKGMFRKRSDPACV